jgi:antitoxin (DNA-binding transcriptional repressor) of toxin-antitoxin stability system
MTKQIDLDDLPPKVATLLAGLQEGEELVLVQHGGVVARLAVAEQAPPQPSEALADLPENERMEEIMSQFRAAIHDEF